MLGPKGPEIIKYMNTSNSSITRGVQGRRKKEGTIDPI